MDEELKKFVEDVRKAFKDAEILLFGSRATGTARPDSDYDLIIVSKKFKGIPYVNRAYEVLIKTNAKIATDVLCYTPDEIKPISKKSIILKNALQHTVSL